MKTAFWVAAGLLALTNIASAAEKGDWSFRAGPYTVNPESSNGDLVRVDDAVSLGFDFTYFYSQNWAIEVLASTPFTHDISLIDGTAVGETKHLPPTLSLQYHFSTEGSFHPYIGAGLNYTLFFDEKTQGPLAGAKLELDGSFGLAAQLGAVVDINDNWFVNAEVRYIQIESDAKLDGVVVTKAEINPLVAGITLGYRF